jgi:hypothetical protein
MKGAQEQEVNVESEAEEVEATEVIFFDWYDSY